jgi:hypothetical protein
MNHFTVWIRLLWKSARTLRGFWLGYLGLIILLAWSLTYIAKEIHGRPVDGTGLWLFGLALPSIFALATPIVIFSFERENGTFGYLRTLPISPRRLIESGIVAGLVGTVAMMAVAGVLIHWVFKYPINERAIQLILPSLLLSLELVAWSTWAAQRYDRSLGAVTRAALGFFLTNIVVVSIWTIYFKPSNSFPLLGFGINAFPIRMVIVGLLICIAWRQSDRWFEDRGRRPKFSERFGGSFFRFKRFTQTTPNLGATSASLFWQTFRQAIPVWRWVGGMLGLLGIFLVTAVLLVLICSAFSKYHYATYGTHAAIYSMTEFAISCTKFYFYLFCLSVLPVIYGVFVFRADLQRKSYHFLTNQGVRPGSFWLSRQLIYGAGFAFIWTIILLTIIIDPFSLIDGLLHHSFKIKSGLNTGILVPPIIFLPLLGYTAGQFISMFVRSGPLGFVLAMILTLVLTGGGSFLQIFGINPIWPILLCVVAMFVSSRLQVGPMINQRSRKIGTIGRFVLPLAITLFITFDLTERLRLDEVYSVQLPEKVTVSKGESLSADERTVLESYVQIKPYLTSKLKKSITPKERVAKVVALFEKAEKIPVLPDRFRNGSVSHDQFVPYLDSLSKIGYELADNEMRARFVSSLDEKDRAAMEWKLVNHLLQMHERLPIGPLPNSKVYLLREISRPEWIHRSAHSSELLKQYITDLEAFHVKGVSFDPVSELYDQLERVMNFEKRLSSYKYHDQISSMDLKNVELIRYWFKILTDILPREKQRIEHLHQLRLRFFKIRLSLFDGTIREGRKKQAEGAWSLSPLPNRFSSFKVERNPNRLRSPLRFENDAKWFETGLLFQMAVNYTRCYSYFRGGRSGTLTDWRSDHHTCLETLFKNEQRLRATQVAFALRAWQLDNDGQFPDTLDSLVGDYLKYMPTDPAGGEPFVYRQKGVDFKKDGFDNPLPDHLHKNIPLLLALPSNSLPKKLFGKTEYEVFFRRVGPIRIYDDECDETTYLYSSIFASNLLVDPPDANGNFIPSDQMLRCYTSLNEYIYLAPKETKKGEKAKKPEVSTILKVPPAEFKPPIKPDEPKKPAKASESMEPKKATQEKKVTPQQEEKVEEKPEVKSDEGKVTVKKGNEGDEVLKKGASEK